VCVGERKTEKEGVCFLSERSVCVCVCERKAEREGVFFK
jgi:hypothetical protein